MKKSTIYLAVVAALSITACSHAKPVAQQPAPTPTVVTVAPAATEILKVSAKVDSVDLANRTVTLKGKDGKLFTMKVSKRVTDLKNVMPGDKFVIQYTQAIALSLTLAAQGTQPGVSEIHTLSVSAKAKGVDPFMEDSQTVFASTKIVSINAKKRVAVLKTADGNLIKVKVDERVLDLNKFKAGNEVMVEYVQDLAIGFMHPTPK